MIFSYNLTVARIVALRKVLVFMAFLMKQYKLTAQAGPSALVSFLSVLAAEFKSHKL